MTIGSSKVDWVDPTLGACRLAPTDGGFEAWYQRVIARAYETIFYGSEAKALADRMRRAFSVFR